jgi:YVTN family beta-propeller protein
VFLVETISGLVDEQAMRRGAPPLAPLLLLALGLLLPLLPAGRARADLVYVLNSGEASISVLDAGTRQEVRRIPTLREPHHLVLSPDRRQLVVGDSAGNELMFLEPETAEVLRRERVSNPYHLDFSPDGRWLVVASLRRDQVDLYEAPAEGQPPRLVHRLRLPDKPSHLAFSPDGRAVYVTLQGSGAVAAIALGTGEVLWRAPVGPEPAGILWHEVPGLGGRLIVGIMGADHFAVLNPETRAVERTIFVGRGAHTVTAAPDGRTLWATSRVDSRLTAIDPATLTMRQVHDIPGGPDCLAFAPDGRVWMTLRWVGRVAALDPATGAVETVRVGRSPHGIFVQPRRAGTAPGPTASAGAAAAAVPVAQASPAPARGAGPPSAAQPASATPVRLPFVRN